MSDADRRSDPRLDRRTFGRLAVRGAAGLLVSALPWRPRIARAASGTGALAPALRDRLASSPYVYVSPLRSDGRESTCHAELWFGWLDDAAVVIVSHDGWKARAVARGLDRARIWVGDHGRWKTWYGGTNEDFRQSPHFEARAERSRDAKLLDRLLGLYETKYPEEIADWRDRMRGGFADGSRVLLRYVPIRPA